MKLTTASIKLSKQILSTKDVESVTPAERAQRDFNSIKLVKEKLAEIEAKMPVDNPDCNPSNTDIWPDCKFERRAEIVEILSETISGFIPDNASASEKLGMTIEYLEEIRRNPSILVSFLEDTLEI